MWKQESTRAFQPSQRCLSSASSKRKQSACYSKMMDVGHTKKHKSLFWKSHAMGRITLSLRLFIIQLETQAELFAYKKFRVENNSFNICMLFIESNLSVFLFLRYPQCTLQVTKSWYPVHSLCSYLPYTVSS